MAQEEELSILSKNDSSFSTANSNTNTNTEQSDNCYRVNLPQLDTDQSSNQLTYGRLFTFYYIDDEPTFAIGPDWPYFACMYTLNVILVIFLMSLIWSRSYAFVLVLGIVLSFIQLGTYLLTAIINPGLPKSNYARLALGKKTGSNYKKCKECNLWICVDTKAYHCYDCGVCFEEYDHHCPWTTKCVARNNLKYFYSFLFSTFILFSYFVFAVVMMSVYISEKRHSS